MRSRNFHVKNDGGIAHSLNTDTVEYLLGSMTGKPQVTPELMAKYGQGMQVATENMWDKSLVHIGQDSVQRSSLVVMAKKQGKPASIPADRTGYVRSNVFDEDASNPIVAVDYQGTGEHYNILAGFVAYRQAKTPMIDVLLVTEKDLQDLIGRTKSVMYQSAEAYQEEQSYFVMDGKRYDLNKIFQMVEGARVRQVSVRKVDWVLDFDKPDPVRVENADIRVPIIVTPYKGGVLLPVDGLHRIARGVEEGASQLPAYVITRAQLEQALIS